MRVLICANNEYSIQRSKWWWTPTTGRAGVPTLAEAKSERPNGPAGGDPNIDIWKFLRKSWLEIGVKADDLDDRHLDP